MPERLYRALRQAEKAIEGALGGPLPERAAKELRRWLARFFELGRRMGGKKRRRRGPPDGT